MSNYSNYLKSKKQSSVDFYSKMYEGLNFGEASNKYCQITKRVSDDETKVLINVNSKQVFSTQYGYGLKVGKSKVVWLKNWQVFRVADWFATEMTANAYQILLNKEYYKVNNSTREFDDINVGDCASDSEFEKANGYHSWEDMVSIAKLQEKAIEDNPIKFKLDWF